jgi:hypothetical protein
MSDYLFTNDEKLYLISDVVGKHERFTCQLVQKNFVGMVEEIYDPVEVMEEVWKGVSLEIVDIVLFHILCDYLKNKNFVLIIQLMSSFSVRFTRRVWVWIFRIGTIDANHLENVRRLSNVFFMVKKINSHLDTPNPAGDMFFKLRMVFPYVGKNQPWDLSPLNEGCAGMMKRRLAGCSWRKTINSTVYTEYSTPQVLTLHEDWLQFDCGLSVGDILWVDGIHEGDFITGTRDLWPVVLIEFLDSEYLPMVKTLFKGENWKRFTWLLKKIYGETLGLFYYRDMPSKSFKRLLVTSRFFDPDDPFIMEAV